MEKLKCANCGLVNWSGAVECGRCFQKIRVSQKPVAVIEQETPAASGIKPFRLLAILVLLGSMGFGAFYYTSNRAAQQKAELERQAAFEKERLERAEYDKDRPTKAQIRDSLNRSTFERETQNVGRMPNDPYLTFDKNHRPNMVTGQK